MTAPPIAYVHSNRCSGKTQGIGTPDAVKKPLIGCEDQTMTGRGVGPQTAGNVVLPSGAVVRGRRLSEIPGTAADFLIALADGPLPPWPSRRIRWPDFWIPASRADALDALGEALQRAREGQLVELACHGGRGRTGTAIAALAVLDGLPSTEAVSWVRRNYHHDAIEMPWQAWWVRRIKPCA